MDYDAADDVLVAGTLGRARSQHLIGRIFNLVLNVGNVTTDIVGEVATSNVTIIIQRQLDTVVLDLHIRDIGPVGGGGLNGIGWSNF
jgi:hypothetical protein